MFTSTAIGFCVILLTKENRKELRDLDERRRTYLFGDQMHLTMAYMPPHEIIYHFRMEPPSPKTEIEVTAMNMLWEDYRKKRWKDKQIEKKLTKSPSEKLTKEFGVGTEPTTEPAEEWASDYLSMNPEDRYLWWEYAAEHYRKPVDRSKVSKLDEAFGMQG